MEATVALKNPPVLPDITVTYPRRRAANIIVIAVII
jgi:hypothetical protein